MTSVAVVETDKAAIEVEVFEDGVVEELLVPEGTKVPVGTPLARLAALPTGVAPAPPPTAVPEPAPVTGTVAAPVAEAPPAIAPRPPLVRSPLVRHLARDLGIDLRSVVGTGPGGEILRRDIAAASRPAPAAAPGSARRVRASPYARRLAGDRGLDLGTLQGSGPDGAVLARDLEPTEPERTAPPVASASAPATTARPGPGSGEDAQTAMRRAIARAMERSKREIPHYYLATWVDLDLTLGWLADHNAGRPPAARVLPAALLLKAVALAARHFPALNGHWVDGRHRPAEHVHLGVAVSLRGGGLIAPAIHDADRLDLDEMMAVLRDLVARARSGGLRGSELTDPTITVSNLGDLGVETAFPVIVPPQVAIVAFGRVTERPVAINRMLAIRPAVHATIAADHRASDGHVGGRFLTTIERLLQRPEEL